MDNRIVTALFKEGEVSCVTLPLFQYDYGQEMVIHGIELPATFEVHFSNSQYGNSTTSIGEDRRVVIPDAYLTSGSDIYAWIFLHDGEDDGETEYKILIPVNERANVTNVEPTPVQQDVITQAIAALNTAVGQAEAAVAHYPEIVGDEWYIYDPERGEMIDSGVPATGPQGEKGDKGDKGDSGLPTVTEADLNKVLTVKSDGASGYTWVAEAVPKELPAVSSSDFGKIISVSSSGSWQLNLRVPVVGYISGSTIQLYSAPSPTNWGGVWDSVALYESNTSTGQNVRHIYHCCYQKTSTFKSSTYYRISRGANYTNIYSFTVPSSGYTATLSSVTVQDTVIKDNVSSSTSSTWSTNKIKSSTSQTLTGTTDPTSSDGKDGDTYIKTETVDNVTSVVGMYVKVSGNWISVPIGGTSLPQAEGSEF